MPPKKRTDREAWEALQAQARADEIAHFVAMPSSQVDARLRAAGHDPAAVRAEGAQLAKKLLADRDRLAWQVEAAEGLAREQARFADRPAKYAGLPASKLRALIAVAQKNPHLAQPVAVMFRNKKAEEASEDELRAILEELDALSESDE